MKASLLAVLLLATISLLGQDQNTTPPPPPCSSEEHRQFDFWLGKWEVFNPDGTKKLGENKISKILKGCALYERWESESSAYKGRSFNTFVPTEGVWKQHWVDNGGGTLEFTGTYADNKMSLTGTSQGPSTTNYHRLTFHNNEDGTVRQHWEQSKDQQTWTTVFDGLYKKKVKKEDEEKDRKSKKKKK